MPLSSVVKRSAVGAALAAERTLRRRPASIPASLADVRSFLFLHYMMPLGYCVHDTPLYEGLRACRPDATIVVATRGTGFETLRHNPFVDQLISTADPLTDLRAAAKELRSGLRRRRVAPQVGITNCSNPRTRITLLNVLAGPHLRLGHTLAPALYHLPQRYDRSLSLIDNNLRLLELFGCARRHYEPRVFFSSANLATVRARLAEAAISNSRPLVVFVTQNSGGQRTGWHADRFAAVIAHVHRMLGCQIAFVGTASDSPAIDALRALAAGLPLPAAAGRSSSSLTQPASVSFAGKTTISELAALLCLADYVVALDTGTMHMGRAAGVPMVVLGPSWQKPLEWLPLGNPKVRILRGADIDHVPENYHLDEIETAPVLRALEELMHLYPASETARTARVEASLSGTDHAQG